MTVETHFYLNEERRLVELTEQPHSRQALRKLFASDAQEKVGTTKAQRTPRHKGHQGTKDTKGPMHARPPRKLIYGPRSATHEPEETLGAGLM